MFICLGYKVRTPAASCLSINGREAAWAATLLEQLKADEYDGMCSVEYFAKRPKTEYNKKTIL